MRKLGFLFFCLSLVSFGQKEYIIDSADFAKREAFIKEYTSSNAVFIASLEQNYQGKKLKKLKEIFEESEKDFIKEIREKNFIFDEQIQSKVNEILQEFKNTSSEIPKNATILVSKNPTLNAYCLPDGIFVANIGLFYWLDNEDQFAGVVAHEIAHKILQHSLQLQSKLVDEELNKTHTNTLKKIQQKNFKKGDYAFNYIKNLLYDQGQAFKKKEFEADSLGYLLLKKTKYNKQDYVMSLKLIEKYDSLKPSGLSKDIYRKFFTIPNQAFKEDWLKLEDFSSYNYDTKREKFNQDSLSTHPEIKQRIEKLTFLYPELKDSSSNKPSESFEALFEKAKHNIIPNLMFFEEYGVATYLTLLSLQRNSDDKLQTYYKEILGKNFEIMYQARKQYKLNRYVERIDPMEHSESYMQFLSFIWNLNATEIKNIADFYSQKQP